MGFYVRKSIRVGPLRFNLSRSGVGVSTGIKGLRVGMGPRGNYVHMGLGGLYYRATIPSPRSVQSKDSGFTTPHIPNNTHAPLEEIESADVTQIVDSSSQDLLDELSRKQQLSRLWPFIAIGGALIWLVGNSNGWPGGMLWFMFLACGAATYVAYVRDELRKTVVVLYDFEKELEGAYDDFHAAAALLAGSAAAWLIEASGQVYDRKYHAGASNLVRRKKTAIRKSEPPYVKTNVETVSIDVGKQTLHFFPDRVLVYTESGVGAVGYKDLRIDVHPKLFIEEPGTVPKDATVVDRTWKYVNKKGGPDRRFKDNVELPVCRYQEFSFRSGSG